MKTKEYLLKVKDFLENENLEWLDIFFLENPKNIPIDILEDITNYITSNNIENKNKAIKLINEYEDKKGFFEKLFKF